MTSQTVPIGKFAEAAVAYFLGLILFLVNLAVAFSSAPKIGYRRLIIPPICYLILSTALAIWNLVYVIKDLQSQVIFDLWRGCMAACLLWAETIYAISLVEGEPVFRTRLVIFGSVTGLPSAVYTIGKYITTGTEILWALPIITHTCVLLVLLQQLNSPARIKELPITWVSTAITISGILGALAFLGYATGTFAMQNGLVVIILAIGARNSLRTLFARCIPLGKQTSGDQSVESQELHKYQPREVMRGTNEDGAISIEQDISQNSYQCEPGQSREALIAK